MLQLPLGVQPDARSFEIINGTFMKDGSPFRIVSGDIHYWRSVPQDWQARLESVKSTGVNTITT
jgi:beta-galactosidase GanA